MFCGSCGHVVDGSYCASCGAPRLGTDPAPDRSYQPGQEDTHLVGEAQLPTQLVEVGQDAAPPEETYLRWEVPSRPTWEGSASTSPDRSSQSALVIAIAVAVVVLVAAGSVLAWFALRDGGTSDASPTSTAGPPTTAPTSASTAPPSPQTDSVTTVTETQAAPTADPAEEARASLSAQRQQSLSGLDLDGRWVLTLSSKYDGVTDPLQTTSSGSNVWRLPDIVEFNDQLVSAMAAEGVPTLVLKATDFGRDTNRNSEEIWMTLADPGGLTSRAAADAWCAEHFPGQSGTELLNSCMPRQLRP